MIVDLTEAEILAIADEMEHSPECAWSNPATCVSYVAEDGSRWADEYQTIPWTERPCTCGYWALRDSAKAKLTAVL